MASKAPGKRDWSGVPIEAIIDREFGTNTELRSGISAYAGMLSAFQGSGDGAAFLNGILDHAGAQYRASTAATAELVTFGDGNCNYLFDLIAERAVLIWGVSRAVAANSRDNAYHAGYPRAPDGFDKGHAWSHAQGGAEGGPNYFPQVRRLNQARSNNGKLWRAIETHLAANAGLSAFIRLIYASGNPGAMPDEVEYGILSGGGQFRAAIFPNS